MSEELIIDAMADGALPKEIMLCILTRLPVKSLLRFKCVCKPWCELFATPKFMKMHCDQFSSYSKNQAFIISDGNNKVSLFSIESDVNKPANLDLPYDGPAPFITSFAVGCCNGLVCLGILFDPYDMKIVLWNPALRLSKFVPVPEVNLGKIEKISLGFGYDTEGDDFRVVKIVCLTEHNTGVEVEVEVYSAKSNTWKTIELGFQFRVSGNYWIVDGNATLNGNPHWVARVDENNESLGSEVLVWCDVTDLELKMVPLSGLRLEEEVAKVPFVDWKGSLAALLCTKKNERLESFDVWVFHNGEMAWRKNHTFKPIEMKVDRCLQCSKTGIIMGDCLDGKLFLFDPETRWVKEIEISEGRKEYLQIYGYDESLAYIEGMQQIVVEEEEEEMAME